MNQVNAAAQAASRKRGAIATAGPRSLAPVLPHR
jgi:hypothetical protein